MSPRNTTTPAKAPRSPDKGLAAPRDTTPHLTAYLARRPPEGATRDAMGRLFHPAFDPTALRMEPLRVTATLAADIAAPDAAPRLDALLAAAVCAIEGRPPYDPTRPMPPVDIPVARAPCGRYHLASFAVSAVELSGYGRFTNRRFPLAEAQAMGDADLRVICLAGGPAKSFRIPLDTGWLHGDRVEWYVVGDREAVARILGAVGYLGRRRAVGLGKVLRWDVEPCTPWGDGFPVLYRGAPTRHLPYDAEGVGDGQALVWGTLTYPYFDRAAEETVWAPAALDAAELRAATALPGASPT